MVEGPKGPMNCRDPERPPGQFTQPSIRHKILKEPDLCLASDLELPELPCAGATPEVTAKLLLVYGSQDFLPGKPHLGNPAHRFEMNQGWACMKPPGATVPY